MPERYHLSPIYEIGSIKVLKGMAFYQILLPMSSFILIYTFLLFIITSLIKGVPDRWMNVLFNMGIIFGAILWVYLISRHNIF
ncbi:hypothetical protein [Alkalihalobacillus sp. TS-13]|uniref:hypothetical protein n=1 Tax=Alkalihalobacillus sp. TS-13 TaxID=2842455 RepID=UPI001C875B0C|nr:hypothetical protein [Alkalihalobacillus sp. TS-13]